MAIHKPAKSPGDIPNPHVHVLVPMRPLKEDGTWGNKQKREYILDENGERIKGADGKYLFNAVKTRTKVKMTAETLAFFQKVCQAVVFFRMNHHRK